MLDCNNVLRLIQAVAPEALVAGGLVRDHLLGRPIKDVDVFVSTKDDAEWDELLEELLDGPLRGGQTRFRCGATYKQWKMRPEVVGVIEIATHHDPRPINIIGLNTPNFGPAAVCGQFDFGICRVAYDGKQIYKTPEFEYDAANEYMSLLRCDNENDFKRAQKRFERLSQKYPGWALNIITNAPGVRPADIIFPKAAERKKAGKCVTCESDIYEGGFRNRLSQREYEISGMCQECQDSVFGWD